MTSRARTAVFLSILLPASAWPAVPARPQRPRFGPGSGAPTHPAYLLITQERLAQLQAKVAANAPEWRTLKADADARVAGTAERDPYHPSVLENCALAYLLTGNTNYVTAALSYLNEFYVSDPESSVHNDSYLAFPDVMQSVAVVLNWCYPALNSAQRSTLITFLDHWTDQLWFHPAPGDSGWGLDDPENNYHMGFLHGTAFAGYALRAAAIAEGKDPNAYNGQKYIDFIKHKLDDPGQVMDVLRSKMVGGAWSEGANYGQRDDQELTAALAVIASMDGTNYFTQVPFFADTVYHAHYEIQPDGREMYPAGDMAWYADMIASPYNRQYVQTIVNYLPDGDARRHGQWFLENIMPSYMEGDNGSFNMPELILLDMIYKAAGPSIPQSALPLSFLSPGVGFMNFRSGWGAGDTSLTVSGAPFIDQSHQHADTGSFTLFKRDWLIVDAATYSDSGLLQDEREHSMLSVDGQDRDDDNFSNVPGYSRFLDGGSYAYTQVNGTNLFRGTINEWTREFVYLRPDTVIIYDRAAPGSGTYRVRFHFHAQPALSGSLYKSAIGGGGVSLLPLASGAVSIASNDNPDMDNSKSWRLDEAGTATRYLNVIQVADGAAPTFSAQRIVSDNTQMEGALWSDQVVMFSSRPLGAAPALPFSYTIPGTGTVTHTLANMSGTCNIAVSKTGGNTTVTVSAGSGFTAPPEGIVRFTN
jgi:hypothetical protein